MAAVVARLAEPRVDRPTNIEWQIDEEPGEVAIQLLGDVGLARCSDQD
jgi:hypothetical protein